MDRSTIILGIESSCDDTSAAVICDGIILSNCVANQDIHQKYGGVVPELASRAHQQNIIPVVEAALTRANVSKKDLSAVAFTRGPGLLGSLLVGTSFAKSFALALDIPLIDVNHMEGHIWAHFAKDSSDPDKQVPDFPFLCLTVSGGHTQIVRMNSVYDFELLGETLDDAAGEAFDKGAKLLGLPYPGGPYLDKMAKEGNIKAFKFPQPQVADLNFSFSGIKTALLNLVKKETAADPEFLNKHLNDICASYQHTIISILLNKLEQAVQKTGIYNIGIAGGVAANSALRFHINRVAAENGWKIFIPAMQYCTDNAGMIAIGGYFKYLDKQFCSQEVQATAHLYI